MNNADCMDGSLVGVTKVDDAKVWRCTLTPLLRAK